MRERLAIVGLALFVALDLVLITLAFRHVQAPATPDRPTAASIGRTTASAAASVDTTTAASAGASAVPRARRLRPRSSPSVTTAPCCAPAGATARPPKDADVSVSTDEGKTFVPTPVQGLTEVLGVRAASEKDLTVIGLGSGCKVSRFTSQDGGDSWTRTAGAGPTWHLSPVSSPDTVASPAGPRTPPCTPAAVSTVNDTLVRLLCDDGKVLGTDDTGNTWVTLGSLPGAVDIRFTSAGVGVALAKQKGCAAAVMQSVDGGSGLGPPRVSPGCRTPRHRLAGQHDRRPGRRQPLRQHRRWEVLARAAGG